MIWSAPSESWDGVVNSPRILRDFKALWQSITKLPAFNTVCARHFNVFTETSAAW